MGKRIPAWAFDLALAAFLFVVSAFELVVLRPDGWQAAIVINGVACALLSVRRRAPLIIGTTAPVVLLSTTLLGGKVDDAAAPILTLAVSIYTLARWRSDLRGLIGLGVIALAIFTDYQSFDARAPRHQRRLLRLGASWYRRTSSAGWCAARRPEGAARGAGGAGHARGGTRRA